jgi:hypothetical protein
LSPSRQNVVIMFVITPCFVLTHSCGDSSREHCPYLCSSSQDDDWCFLLRPALWLLSSYRWRETFCLSQVNPVHLEWWVKSALSPRTLWSSVLASWPRGLGLQCWCYKSLLVVLFFVIQVVRWKDTSLCWFESWADCCCLIVIPPSLQCWSHYRCGEKFCLSQVAPVHLECWLMPYAPCYS